MNSLDQILPAEQRQANIQALIDKYKASKKQSKEDLERDRNNPKFQEIIKNLRKQYE
jgi:hypothetical protein